MLEGKLNFQLTDHNSCRLGKWYAEEGKGHFGKTNAFQSIEVPHKQVHDAIAKAMQKLDSRDIDEIIALFKDAEEASLELFEYLDNIIKED
ncbi:CZB domain-containing protein [Sulfurimonas sp. NWX79]